MGRDVIPTMYRTLRAVHYHIISMSMKTAGHN